MAAIIFVAVLSLLLLFQLALALGAPWGRFAWGGQHPGVLPQGHRIASAFSILLYGFMAIVVLNRAGFLVVLSDSFSRVGIWVVFTIFALGVVLNAISRSKPERYVMAPMALVLAALALVTALSPAAERLFSGMVLDNGSGPVFCTTVMESYSPQCGRGSPSVHGWDWNDVAHEQSQATRWSEYSFTAVHEDHTIIVVDAAVPLR
ncbi:hypothetical protein [Paeniglutamicibacter sp. Y32M11]|uniref:hypothetical protein n=1 Tax=Paeniglutamicibacter sp. Y32M11 TaxID=2853258 RepID=UPI001C533D18|nr:hypothetical protein [Paeniglutamicibacter sp. Y32M11]QXQ10808.1 hypothetical protein KUF55_02420 [Paeniglutamicibacter sp. Y32M11]